MQAATDVRSTNCKFTRAMTASKSFRTFLVIVLGVIGTVPLVFLTPPFQVPDEVQHFYRAYQVGQFHFQAEVKNGIAGGTLPVSLRHFAKASVYTPDGIDYPATPISLVSTLSFASIPLNEFSTQFVSFPGSAFYSPLPYLPQAFGIACGRFFGLSPLYLLYLGRLFNCLAAVAIITFAVRMIPAVEELIVLVGFLPMAVYLYASLSPDAAVISCALLFTALSTRTSNNGEWKKRELAVAAIAATVFCSVKPVYLPLLLAPLLPGLTQPGMAVRTIRSQAILIAVALGVTGCWLWFAKSSMTSPLSGAHPSAQMHLILSHPMTFLTALRNSLGIENMMLLYCQTVGQFGWLKVLLRPGIVYLLPLVNFSIIWFLGTRVGVKRRPAHALWCVFLAMIAFLLIFAAMYLMWAQVGLNSITGVQGRYFIPILALVAVALMGLAPRLRPSAPKSWALMITIGFIAVEIIAMDATVIHAFKVL